MAQQALRLAFPTLIVIAQNIRRTELVSALLQQPKIVYAIASVVHNTLLSNIRLSTTEKARLKNFRTQLYELVRKNRSAASKVHLLLQHSCLLKLLVKLSVEVLSELLKSDGKADSKSQWKEVCASG